MKYIGLLDCNNFFVSCERLFRPDLRRVPTVVLSGNDGCVVARSKEIKDMGIPMGVPYFKVKDELKKVNTAVFSSNFTLYRDISRRVMETLKQEVGFVEQYSVDEAFFAIDMERDSTLDALERVKSAVEIRVGVPVSVGCAKTKTIAKYASEVGKKGQGVVLVTGSAWYEATKEILVHEIWGIGRQTTQKMRELGILTVSDFLGIDLARIDKIFGISGLRLHDELSEKVVHELGTHRNTQKSIMSTRSFENTTEKKSVIEDSLAYHVGHVAMELREMNMKAGWIKIIAQTSRHGDWILHGGSSDSILSIPTDDTRELLKEALRLLDSLYEKNVPYKKTGVVLGNFTDSSYVQMDFFSDNEQKEKNSAVMETVDTLNRRFGNQTVTIGRNDNGEEWKASKNFVSPCYTTKWNQIRSISV